MFVARTQVTRYFSTHRYCGPCVKERNGPGRSRSPQVHGINPYPEPLRPPGPVYPRRGHCNDIYIPADAEKSHPGHRYGTLQEQGSRTLIYNRLTRLNCMCIHACTCTHKQIPVYETYLSHGNRDIHI